MPVLNGAYFTTIWINFEAVAVLQQIKCATGGKEWMNYKM